ncbi:hypothetical protein LJC42_05880 [Eubacteriales bacterium OttesenSCG-928-K08]|nr:hypothetical protein [Eubacteriales bacterium OttesenSCG-928-K08]
MNQTQSECPNEMLALCSATKTLIKQQNYEECEQRLCDAMSRYPHSPVPHNLMGIVLEKQDCHTNAMRHFRAAYALDPNYSPARHNLDHYGTFFHKSDCAYDESDCEPEAAMGSYDIKYDEHGIKRAIRRD